MKEYRYEINGKKYRVRVREIYGDHAVVQVNDDTYQVDMTVADVAQTPPPAAAGAAREPAPAPTPGVRPAAGKDPSLIRAPMPGVILKVLVGVGDVVNAGEPVMIIEAMKMENEIKASSSGTVRRVMIEKGDSVNTGDELMKID